VMAGHPLDEQQRVAASPSVVEEATPVQLRESHADTL
jgi:hypothetical protein